MPNRKQSHVQVNNKPAKSVCIRRREATAVELSLPAVVPDLLRTVYANRGLIAAEDYELPLNALAPVGKLKSVEQAAEILAGVMEIGGKVVIVGDFDADGATSCALAVLALKAMGHEDLDFLVPNRFDYGYGLTPEIVELALQRGPDLIITVDNGISSLEGIEAAHRAGVSVIVTDHHLPGHEIPKCAAIVNPNQPGDTFPSKNLAGVGVIFYLLLALRARLRQLDWFERMGIEPPNMAGFLDLVALGTVADVVPLDRNNRILVKHGLARIRQGRCRPGILCLLEVAGRTPQRVQASDMGFAVGPRLNAAGRLTDMAVGIRCLLAEDESEARSLAQQLDKLNRERREIEQEMKETAQELLSIWQESEEDLPWGLCLYQEGWHQGVIGILASRIKERYHRPVIVFARENENTLKGSARSIPGLHIRDALDRIATLNPDLLRKFGGHAMAAGMSLAEANFEKFKQMFDDTVRQMLDENDLEASLLTDGGVTPQDMTLDTALALARGGPWGQGCAEPLFDDVFAVQSSRVVGNNHWKMTLMPEAGGESVDGIAFNALERWPELPARVHVAYHLEVNEWQGRQRLQLRIQHLESAT